MISEKSAVRAHLSAKCTIDSGPSHIKIKNEARDWAVGVSGRPGSCPAILT